ncbi:MAG: hypothetical protein J6A78_04900 [Clostridia bacterium]|nr:hypothetical protein [Clostridia bacterium]
MKKYILAGIFPIFISLGLSGCNFASDGKTSFSVIYCITAVIAALLLIGCMFWVHKNKKWFILLFSSVLIVNSGYTFLSVSNGLEMALWANRLSYLGSVFLPLAMLMIILNITNTKCKKNGSNRFVCTCNYYVLNHGKSGNTANILQGSFL